MDARPCAMSPSLTRGALEEVWALAVNHVIPGFVYGLIGPELSLAASSGPNGSTLRDERCLSETARGPRFCGRHDLCRVGLRLEQQVDVIRTHIEREDRPALVVAGLADCPIDDSSLFEAERVGAKFSLAASDAMR